MRTSLRGLERTGRTVGHPLRHRLRDVSPGDDEAQAELLRKFQSAIAGTELSDLRRLAGNLSLIRGGLARPARPELRRPPRAEVATYRVKG
jgi:hypothetical protein